MYILYCPSRICSPLIRAARAYRAEVSVHPFQGESSWAYCVAVTCVCVCIISIILSCVGAGGGRGQYAVYIIELVLFALISEISSCVHGLYVRRL